MGTKSEQTRERLLRAALHCMTHLGVEKTSHARIARRAKVSRSLVAHYFPAKSKLFPEVVRFVTEEAYAYFRALPAGEDRGPRGAKALAHERLERNVRYFVRHPDHYKCIVLLYYRAAIDRAHRKLNTALIETAVRGLEEPLKTALSASRARRAAESLHNELIASIQKFYMTEHAEGGEAFVARMGAYFSERLDELISTPA